MTLENSSAFLFDDLRVERAMFRAFKAGNAIQFEPKAFRLLLFLIENRGRLIEKDEILEVVWNGTHVTENALASEIANCERRWATIPKHRNTFKRCVRGAIGLWPKCANRTVPSKLDLRPRCPGSSEFDSAPRSNNQEHASSNAVVFQRQASTKAWGMRLAVMGIIVTLVVAALISLKIYQGSRSTATTLPVAIRQITTWPGMDFNPSFSPDEESIAYSSDHNGSFEIYTRSLAPGAREVQLTSDGQQNFDPAWSPDGKRIAYYSMKRHGIFTMPALGGLATQLTDFGSHPVWSPDGQWLAFQSVSSPDLDAVPMGSSPSGLLVHKVERQSRSLILVIQPARTLRPRGHRIVKRLSSLTLIPPRRRCGPSPCPATNCKR